MFLFFGGLAALVGGIMSLAGLVEGNKKKLQKGALLLASGAIGLMVSFTLCSRGGL